MIPAKELSTMKETLYGEDAVNLFLSYLNTMINVIQAAKYGDDSYIIFGEEYYEEDTPESIYVIDSLRELGYTVEKDCLLDFYGEPEYSTIISWGRLIYESTYYRTHN